MNKLFLFSIYTMLLLSYPLQAIKIKIISDEKFNLNMQFNIEVGAGIAGAVNSETGRMDYNTFFFRPAFHINNFGIGFDLSLRFSRFPDLMTFNNADWEKPDNGYKTWCSIINKIHYTVYSDRFSPLYIISGNTPAIKAGSGLLINSLSNNSYSPAFKEHGFYAIFNGLFLKFPLPFNAFFYIPDIADPDIFLFGGTVDISHFLNNNSLSLSAGLYGAIDADSVENSFLSAMEIEKISNHRNGLYSENTVGITLPQNISYDFSVARIQGFSETALLFKKDNLYAAQYFELRGDFIQIPDSGYLLSIPFGLTISDNGFYPGYFSNNYHTTRQTQFLNDNPWGNIFFNYGIYLSGIYETVTFGLLVTSPFEMEHYTASYEGIFRFDGDKRGFIKGLMIDVSYKTSMRNLNINGDGGFFIYSITKDFRFAIDIEYKIFNSKINFVAGLQSPQWINSKYNDIIYKYTQINENNEEIITSTIIVTDTYGGMLEKFMRLEVSFVF